MSRTAVGTLVAVCLLWAIPHVHGQKMTEMFIPIGESPGVSGKTSIIGTIRSVNPQQRTVVVANDTGSHTTTVTENTWIWLDRSKLGLPNETGSFVDLQNGSRVEIKYDEDDQKKDGKAEWIKVEIT